MQLQQVEHLRDPRPCEPVEPGQVRLVNTPGVEQPLELLRQSQRLLDGRGAPGPFRRPEPLLRLEKVDDDVGYDSPTTGAVGEPGSLGETRGFGALWVACRGVSVVRAGHAVEVPPSRGGGISERLRARALAAGAPGPFRSRLTTPGRAPPPSRAGTRSPSLHALLEMNGGREVSRATGRDRVAPMLATSPDARFDRGRSGIFAGRARWGAARGKDPVRTDGSALARGDDGARVSSITA